MGRRIPSVGSDIMTDRTRDLHRPVQGLHSLAWVSVFTVSTRRSVLRFDELVCHPSPYISGFRPKLPGSRSLVMA